MSVRGDIVPVFKLPKPKLDGYATLSLYISHSVYDEPPEIPGANHIIEHVLASNFDVDKAIGSKGLVYNAETHGGYVRYWFSTPLEHFQFCLNFLKKISTEPEFKYVKREANAVRQELLTLLEDTDYHMELAQINTLFPNTAYARGSNAHLELDTLPKFNSKMMRNYYEKNYVNKMFIVVSGGPSVVKGAKTIKTIPRSKVSSVPKMICGPFPNKQKNVVHIQRTEVEKSKCVLTFYNDLPCSEQRNETLLEHVIGLTLRVLSGGQDSLLYRVLREKLQLVYRVSCSAMYEPYGIIIEISWSCDTNKVKQSLDAVFGVLQKFKPHHFDGHKTLYMEDLVKDSIISSEDIVDTYGGELVTWGNYEKIEDIIKRVEKIKAEDTINVVKNFMKKERCFLIHCSSKASPPISKF